MMPKSNHSFFNALDLQRRVWGRPIPLSKVLQSRGRQDCCTTGSFRRPPSGLAELNGVETEAELKGPQHRLARGKPVGDIQ